MSETIVKPMSSQWIYVNFRVQLLLGHPNINILSVKKKIPVFPSNYEQFLKIEGAVDVTNMDLPSIQSIKSSLKKDLVIKAGRIHRKFDNSSAEKEAKYRMILVKLAINQILPAFKEPHLSSEHFLANNPHYDSVYCTPRQQELSVFNHEYILREAAQYQWEYDVSYSYTQFEEWNAQNFKCQNCKLRKASYYCSEDKEAYCEPCYSDLHRSDKKMKHKKEPLTPYNCPPHCQRSMHESELLTHYCFNCQELKCKNCLQDGKHKKGSTSNPQDTLHEVLECRQIANLFKQKEKQNFSEIKVRIAALIREIEAKVQLISSHYEIKLKEIVRLFEQRSKMVREQAIEQLNKATGFHCELKRKYDEMLWLQSFSSQLQQKCKADMGMRVKQGINKYINYTFSPQYFKLLDKKVQELKIFN